MKKKKLIYVAGALNSDAVGYIQNLHKIIKCADEIRRCGFATFCPGLDFLSGLVDGDWGYTDYYDNHIPILLRCDAVFVTPGWEGSQGTAKEIQLAADSDIPVFYSTILLVRHFSISKKRQKDYVEKRDY